MKITIEIPEEFEIDYKTDKFKDFFQRVLADMDYVCGNYERETAEMLIKAFESSNPVKEDRKSTRLNSSHTDSSRMPSSA